jgi:hypothetical protein
VVACDVTDGAKDGVITCRVSDDEMEDVAAGVVMIA